MEEKYGVKVARPPAAPPETSNTEEHQRLHQEYAPQVKRILRER
jgi:hypothetical protein